MGVRHIDYLLQILIGRWGENIRQVDLRVKTSKHWATEYWWKWTKYRLTVAILISIINMTAIIRILVIISIICLCCLHFFFASIFFAHLCLVDRGSTTEKGLMGIQQFYLSFLIAFGDNIYNRWGFKDRVQKGGNQNATFFNSSSLCIVIISCHHSIQILNESLLWQGKS